MKVSTKGRYGLRAMIDIAVYSAGEHVSIGNIAKRQEISDKYLEQVFSILRKAGLVKSVKGAEGGYALAQSASEIKVGSVLRALEGSLSLIDSESTENAAEDSVAKCIKELVWDKMNDRLNELVEGVTLQDLADEYIENQCSFEPMYFI